MREKKISISAVAMVCHRKKLLACYCLLLLMVPTQASYYTLFVEFIGTMLSLVTVYILFMYYSSGTALHQTSLNSTMKLLMVFEGLYLTFHFFIWTLLFHGFTEFTKNMFYSYPNIVCSIISLRYAKLLLFYNFTALLILKGWLTTFPYHFFNRNQEKVFVIVFVLILSCLGLEICVAMICYGTFCPKDKLTLVIQLHGYELNEDEIPVRHTTILVYILIVAGPLVEVGSRMYSAYQKRRQKKGKKQTLWLVHKQNSRLVEQGN